MALFEPRGPFDTLHPTPRSLFPSLLAEARALLHRGDPAGAAALLETAARPADGQAWALLGTALRHAKQPDQAVAANARSADGAIDPLITSAWSGIRGYHPGRVFVLSSGIRKPMTRRDDQR